jgi:hypothetical protein
MAARSISLMMKGDKYNLKQGKTEIICDGANVYTYDGDKTITKASLAESSQTLSPQKLLAGSYDKDFTYKLVSSKGAFHEIEMKPIDNRKNFQKVNLFIDKAKNTFSRARIVDKSNNITELKIANMNLNATVPDAKLIFNKIAVSGQVALTPIKTIQSLWTGLFGFDAVAKPGKQNDAQHILLECQSSPGAGTRAQRP